MHFISNQENFTPQHLSNEYIGIAKRDHTIVMNIKNLVICKADGNSTIFILKDGEKIKAAKTLLKYEKFLTSRNFIRVGRGNIINKEFIKKITKNSIVLSDGHEISLPVRKSSQVQSYLLSLEPNFHF